MRSLISALLVASLCAGAGAPSALAQSPSPSPVVAARTPPTDPTSVVLSPPGSRGGLELLPRVPSFPLGLGQISRIVHADGRLVAVGSLHYPRADISRGAAWTSSDGLDWERTHRLPPGTRLIDAVPLSEDSLLVFGVRTTKHKAFLASWRLGPGGHVSKMRRLPFEQFASNVARVAGDPSTGLVAVFGDWLPINVRQVRWDKAAGLEAWWRAPAGTWQAIELPGSLHAHPYELATTASGFVLVGEDQRGLLAWRSADGRTWDRPEVLSSSLRPGRSHLAKAVVYDELHDNLLVIGYPDSAWLSAAGGPFELWGSLAAPIGRGDIASGIALADGWLLASGGESAMTLQTSPDGSAWTVAPELPHYDRSMVTNLVVQGDRVIGTNLDPVSILVGGATISAYGP